MTSAPIRTYRRRGRLATAAALAVLTAGGVAAAPPGPAAAQLPTATAASGT